MTEQQLVQAGGWAPVRLPPPPYWREWVEDLIDSAQANSEETIPTRKLFDALPNLSDTRPDQTCVQTSAQAIVIWSEGRAYVISDTAPVPDYLAPVEKAVTIARLRAIADTLEAQGTP